MCEPCFLYVNVSYSNILIFFNFCSKCEKQPFKQKGECSKKKEAARVDESQYGSSSEDDRRAKTVKGEARGAEELKKPKFSAFGYTTVLDNKASFR